MATAPQTVQLIRGHCLRCDWRDEVACVPSDSADIRYGRILEAHEKAFPQCAATYRDTGIEVGEGSIGGIR